MSQEEQIPLSVQVVTPTSSRPVTPVPSPFASATPTAPPPEVPIPHYVIREYTVPTKSAAETPLQVNSVQPQHKNTEFDSVKKQLSTLTTHVQSLQNELRKVREENCCLFKANREVKKVATQTFRAVWWQFWFLSSCIATLVAILVYSNFFMDKF